MQALGVGAVADDVAGAPEAVDGARLLGVAEDGLESFEVGVDVGGDEDAHVTLTAGSRRTCLRL